MAQAEYRPFEKLLTSTVPVPDWWTSREPQIQGFLDRQVPADRVRMLANSPGGRPVRAAFFGDAEPELLGPANFNAALGAQQPEAYCRRRERKRPVLMILAGVHGAEVEGMIGALSAINVFQTGSDIAGNPQPDLADRLRQLRVIVIPLANPDGRVRVPYDGWLGLPCDEMHRVGQGTRRDGSSYGWPACKAVHPMAGDVGGLGGYFDDAGVNMMHDEWSASMSPVTAAVLRLIREEAPDIVLNCHSHANVPSILHTAYAPQAVKENVAAFALKLYTNLTRADLPHPDDLPWPRVDGARGEVPPAMNLTSMMYHVGAALPMTFECPHGFTDGRARVNYEQILAIHHVLLRSAADWLLRRPVR